MKRLKYKITETTPPAAEPVALADMKQHLRVTSGDDDSLITAQITAARGLAEALTGLSFINRGYTLYLDAWPERAVLELPRPPLVAVAAITLRDEDGTSTPYAASSYFVDNAGLPGRIVLKSGALPPVAARQTAGIEISYTAGYGAAASAVPEVIKAAIMQLVTHLYQHRGDSGAAALEQSGALALLHPFRQMGETGL